MKSNKLSRRKFMGLAAAFSSVAILPGSFFRKVSARTGSSVPHIVSVSGADHYKATIEAVNTLGGMSEFVRKNSKVGLLINGNFTNPATFTNPDVSLAVLKMCYDAGAKDVMLIQADKEENWQKSVYYDRHIDLLAKTTRSAGNKMFTIEKGVILKEAEMVQELLEFDTLINIPIAKHHNSAFLTCCLKNMMGLCTRSTNVLFHSAEGKAPTDNDRLAQSIADVNTIRIPDLTIVDASSFIINNGPHGPGEIQEENKVLAGTDPVALDAFCATFHDFEAGMVASTDYAAAHNLGVSDLSKIQVKEIELS